MFDDTRRVPADAGPGDLISYLREVAMTACVPDIWSDGPTSIELLRGSRGETKETPIASMLEVHREQGYYLWWLIRSLRRDRDVEKGRTKPSLEWPTDPLPVLAKGHEVRACAPQSQSAFEPARESWNLIRNAEAIGLVVTWYEGPRTRGGYVARPRSRSRLSVARDVKSPPEDIDPRDLPAVTRGDGFIALNKRQEWVSSFDVLVHEVAHVLLGHLEGWSTLRQAGLSVADRRYVPTRSAEIEVWCVGLLVAARRGADESTAEEQLERRVALGAPLGDLWPVDLYQVMAVADIITAWCAEPPRATGVKERRYPQLSGGRGNSGAAEF